MRAGAREEAEFCRRPTTEKRTENKAVADEYQVGIDIGGTFTDVVILNPASGRLFLGKTVDLHG